MLSIIIVNYKSVQHILNCLQSASRYPGFLSYEWIVVDNEVDGNCMELIKQAFPSVKYFRMGYNAGFARANNAGMRKASGDVFLLLNPDVLFSSDVLPGCLQRFNESSYAACSVQLRFADGTPQITGNYFIKGALNLLLPLPYIGALVKKAGQFFGVKKTNVEEAKSLEVVDWINGAFLMVKKEVVQQAGMLDEDFFLYAEEIEWCSRLRKTGELCVYGDLDIVHLQGETINAATGNLEKGYYNLYDKKGLQLIVSNLLRVRKQWGLLWYLFHLAAYSFAALLYLFIFPIQNLISGKLVLHNADKASGFFTNMIKTWRLFPKMVRLTPYFYKMI
ncbi:glycosyltransferase family 2 protein [Parasegetibacter sp. NRK P23]|uniref:glycosyltransferase family 2 protein n=1 Tax=Parasegetibacter sp. NRK P23 TaxID=2942999 RepID=UPI00204361F6|nr:glycosyltransferase family 2 protein [Parasegetibacter sp. NRK P23]MCM5528541.1 glycosyltransferase family 2 protein [Parasegetibacter sp. NRK P23]